MGAWRERVGAGDGWRGEPFGLLRTLVGRAVVFRAVVRVDHDQDGQGAIDALDAGASRPDLVLLDLTLTGLQGLDVLAQIKSDVGMRSSPVVVLTTSVSDHDRAEAFRRHASAYIQKPEGLDEFRAVAGALVGFWAGCHVRR